jgi:hypothetical protein
LNGDKQVQSETLTNLRDFVYLDVERIKSLVAQQQGGVIVDQTQGNESMKGGGGKLGLKIPMLADAGVNGEYAATNRSSETRTLHDFVFSEMESGLIKNEQLIVISNENVCSDELVNELRSSLTDVDYVLIRGRLRFFDFDRMDSLLGNINDLVRATVHFQLQDTVTELPNGAERNRYKNLVDRAMNDAKIDEQTVKHLRKVLDLFVKDRLVIKIRPADEFPALQFAGPLSDQWLRESRDHIRFKYGASPYEPWNVFAQIATIPQEARKNTFEPSYKSGNPLDLAFEQVFAPVSDLDAFFQVTYPEIAITPIAIYRE